MINTCEQGRSSCLFLVLITPIARFQKRKTLVFKKKINYNKHFSHLSLTDYVLNCFNKAKCIQNFLKFFTPVDNRYFVYLYVLNRSVKTL